jgi:WD40 repeat protein
VWEASTGGELVTLRGHQSAVRNIVWSPDGTKLATASADQTAKVWDVYTGREWLTLRGIQGPVPTLGVFRKSLVSIAWSPDGTKLATTSLDKPARVWDSATGRQLLTLRGRQENVSSVAWSPDGTKLATAGLDQTTRVWDASTGRELLTLRGHQAVVSDIAWSPDGTRLASAGGDRTTRVWDARDGHELVALHNQGVVWSVAWSPDGTKLVTASNFTAQVYAIGPVQLLRLVHSRIIRDLTPDECRRYLNMDHCPQLPHVP